MTYNVNYGTAGDEETLALIAQSGADVVLLQETNPAWERALRRALSGTYPHMAFLHADRRAGGLAF
ncbi:MAG TPA: endonuclease/exonuclease/phosphatase family protein, partial [Kofleriaceae bacterium]|nr:endonuclease/exonuclease/phosphatase family protein [Kofleriaceae bacterium]